MCLLSLVKIYAVHTYTLWSYGSEVLLINGNANEIVTKEWPERLLHERNILQIVAEACKSFHHCQPQELGSCDLRIYLNHSQLFFIHGQCIIICTENVSNPFLSDQCSRVQWWIMSVFWLLVAGWQYLNCKVQCVPLHQAEGRAWKQDNSDTYSFSKT